MFRSVLSTIALVLVALFLASPLGAQRPSDAARLAVDGDTIFYEIRGQGEPLLLLHYFGGCGAVWQPFIAKLAASYQLIIPDLPGHGRSSGLSGDFRHETAARRLFTLLDSLRVSRFRAIGLSSGGMTMLHMATQQPARVKDMVLVGATSYFPAQARDIMERSVPERLTPEEYEEWGACSSRGDTQTREILASFHGMKDSWTDMNFTPPLLSTIRARTLIVHGDRDVFFPVQIPVDMYGAIDDAQLWIVPGGDHIPVLGPLASRFTQVAIDFFAAGTVDGSH